MQTIAMNAANFTTPAQLVIAPAKVDMIVKNVFFVAIVAIIVLAVNL